MLQAPVLPPLNPALLLQVRLRRASSAERSGPPGSVTWRVYLPTELLEREIVPQFAHDGERGGPF